MIRAMTSSTELRREDWAPDVKRAINELLLNHGENCYAVFDFDNTTAIFDVEEQLAVFNMQIMAYAIAPQNFKSILLTGIKNPEQTMEALGLPGATLSELAEDIADAYSLLWDSFGGFSAKGVSEAKLPELHADPHWLEFAAKLRFMYDAMIRLEPASVSYPWILYLLCGMSEDEVYALCRRALSVYMDRDTELVTWKSPAEIKSRVGQVECSWYSGISPAESMRELWAALSQSGIDVWVCSASGFGSVRAAIDAFGLHRYCRGMLAMANAVDEKGRYINSIDLNACGYLALPDGTWRRSDYPMRAMTEHGGKSEAIVSAIAPYYNNQGPAAGFMDASGDFNFCTEFASMRLCLCFNRGNRTVRDGGGLIAAMALYQRDCLGYELSSANERGDTLYLLQGRDENGTRSFRASNATLRLGEDKERLLAGEENYAMLEYMKENRLSVKQALDTLCLIRSAEDSALGIPTGFLTEYMGYHSR